MRARLANKLLAKIPSHVKITPKVSYEILFIPEFKDAKTLGETRYQDVKQIVIKSGEPPSHTISTIIHELIHSIDIENKIGLTEKQVLGLEEGIFRALEANKLFDLLGKID